MTISQVGEDVEALPAESAGRWTGHPVRVRASQATPGSDGPSDRELSCEELLSRPWVRPVALGARESLGRAGRRLCPTGVQLPPDRQLTS